MCEDVIVVLIRICACALVYLVSLGGASGWSEVRTGEYVSPLAEIGLAMAGSAKAELSLAGLGAEIDAAMARLNVPGLALVVVVDGRVAMLYASGWRDVSDRLPVTPRTLFPIGSATKPFTAFVLGSLADEKRIDFFAPVKRVLPSFRLADHLASERTTIADLLTHRAGLPRHDAVWYGDSGLTRAELVRRLPFLETTRRFRSGFQYSNLLFTVAGHAAEVAAGDSWENLVYTRILRPLGMERTVFSLDEAQVIGEYALPYRDRGQGTEEAVFRDLSVVAPAGGLWSSTDDLSRWLSMLLARGQWEGRPLIDEGTLTALMRPITPTRLPSDSRAVSQAYYGLGWFVDTYRGRLRAFHGGNLDGFSSLVTLFPNDRIGIAVLTNLGGSGLPEALVRTIADRLLGRHGEDWLGRAASLREGVWGARERIKAIRAGRRVPDSAPALTLGGYVGRYTHPGYGSLLIVAGEEGLEMLYNGIRSPLVHWHFEVFNVGSSQDPSFEGLKVDFVGDGAWQASAIAVPFEPAGSTILFRRDGSTRVAPFWPDEARGEFQTPSAVVTVELDGEVWRLSWPGAAAGSLIPTAPGEARVEGEGSARVRYMPALDGEPARLMLFSVDSVRVASRVATGVFVPGS